MKKVYCVINELTETKEPTLIKQSTNLKTAINCLEVETMCYRKEIKLNQIKIYMVVDFQ